MDIFRTSSHDTLNFRAELAEIRREDGGSDLDH
jgi:hypothetical protein